MDLRPQHEQIRDELDQAVERVRSSNRYLLGDELEAFESEFAAFLASESCVGVGSGTDALHLALLALHVTAGDEVILPSHSFISTALAVTRVGATTVFVDIDPVTYNLDPAKVEAAVTGRTKAIIPVHLYGQPADMTSLLEIAEHHNLFVIEDACQAHGAFYKNERAGTLGDVGCFSFYPTKNLGAWGDGGAIVAKDRDVVRRARALRNLGQSEKNVHESLGFVSRLDELQAAILRAKLPHLDVWNSERQRLADLYRVGLSDADIVLPQTAPDTSHVFHLFVIATSSRSLVQRRLADLGIQTQVHYPIPVHRQPPYEKAHLPHTLKETNRAAESVLSLPFYVGLSGDQIAHVTAEIRACG